MPSTEFDKASLLKRLGKKISDEELVHAITFLGTELESVEAKTVKVEIFPNRPDLLSEVGMARALRAYLGIETGFIEYKVTSPKLKVICTDDVDDVRPFISCCIVRNLKLTKAALDQIIQAQEKLHVTFGRKRARCAIGIYPMEKLHFPITYTAKKPADIKFTPLDSSKPMTAQQILQTHPKGKEFKHLLEGKSKYPLFVDAKGTVLSMPPVINSEEAGRVTLDTKDVFVECSGSNQAALDKCLAMLATLLEAYGGTIEALTIEQHKKSRVLPDLDGFTMTLDPEYALRRSGLDLTPKQMVSLLEKMGHSAQVKGKELVVRTPSYREDMIHPIDLVEDICIAYGFDNVKPIYQFAATSGSQLRITKVQDKMSEVLIGLGCLEVAGQVLTSEHVQEHMMHGSGKVSEHVVKIQNPSSEEINAVAAWLTPMIMQVLANNKRHPYPQSLFCHDQVVIQTGDGSIKEEKRCVIGLCSDKVTYTTAKQHLEYVLGRLGLKGWSIIASDHPSFIAGRCGRIVINNKSIGIVGEIHPQVLVNFGLQYPVAVVELLNEKIEGLLFE